MSDNPYNIPSAEIKESRKYFDNDISDKVLKRMNRIRNVVIIILILKIISVVIAFVIIKNLVLLYSLIDVPIIAGLAFGIIKRSRVCSTIFCVYYIGSHIFNIILTGKFSGLLIPVIMIFFILDDTIAIYEYHKTVKRINVQNSNISLST